MDERPLSLREQGIEALRAGDDDRAIDLLTRAVLVDSRDAEARACLGITASRKGLHVRALSALREAVTLEPDNVNFRYNLGVALERSGDLADACRSFQEVLQLAPDHGPSRQKLAALEPGVFGNAPEAPAAPTNPTAFTPSQVARTAEVPDREASIETSEAPVSENENGPYAGGGHSESSTPVAPSPESLRIAEPAIPIAEPPVLEAEPPKPIEPAPPPPVMEAGVLPPPAWQQPPPVGYPSPPPYSGYQPVPAYGHGYLRAHRGNTIQGMGIGSLVTGMLGFCCLIFGVASLGLGIAAWVSGNQDLKEMDAGNMDPSGRAATQTGRVMGMVMTILSVLTTVAWTIYVVIMFLAGAASGASGG